MVSRAVPIGRSSSADAIERSQAVEAPSSAAEAEHLASLPLKYRACTSQRDRLVHMELLKRLRESEAPDEIVTKWRRSSNGTTMRLYLVFRDRLGSLSAICTLLNEVNINILEAAVFCTMDGYAVDTILCDSNWEPDASLDQRLRQTLAAAPEAPPPRFGASGSSLPEGSPEDSTAAGSPLTLPDGSWPEGSWLDSSGEGLARRRWPRHRLPHQPVRRTRSLGSSCPT